MKQEDFEIQAKDAAKAMLKKKAPTKPETQFIKGALWAWELLMTAKAPIYYEEKLRQEVTARLGEEGMRENAEWIESLISDTAALMADRDGMLQDIIEEGRLIRKLDKNMNEYKESNPLYVHKKELDRTIGMQREHLGLSFKVNPNRMKESPKQGDMEKDPMYQFVKGRKK